MDLKLYLKQLHDYVVWQQQEINRLQETMAQLSADIQKLKEKPSVTVERLEYKFDQLKVETLEGTLNIGLNPADLNNIDDFSAVPSMRKEKNPEENQQMKTNLLEKLNEYVEQQLDAIIHDSESQIGIQLEESYFNLIKEDIRKQLPTRAEHYLHFFSTRTNENMTNEQLFEKMYKTIVADINNGVHTFIAQMPQNRKEGK
ncbi:spore germination protein GerPC [Lederbergia wuyishanensis]|uniref:Spore germination protein PC n=1 Tax=Lederbergia wuyishanensis TaxID=1347903 RepID=A0ABU0CYV6_9BACI|nr:spore germination protein GerPC [Lederbergia wuyishanensis]MCJ8005974.1 spore germination protein GerPC [Lederbergia wuyishanensis]MDQ0341339.1 spore germination protein PC [Lederbergia wuyishanensis]